MRRHLLHGRNMLAQRARGIAGCTRHLAGWRVSCRERALTRAGTGQGAGAGRSVESTYKGPLLFP
jgi:hypothetical protein